MEYCSKGSLYHVLTNPEIQIDWKLGISFAVQMAEAMAFLHNFDPQILHRDMKSLNLLVNSEWQVKIADFGLGNIKNLYSE